MKESLRTQHAATPAIVRTHTVVMGRQDFFSVLLRLIGTELYKIKRRLLSKVLIAFLFSLMLVTLLLITLISVAFNGSGTNTNMHFLLSVPATINALGWTLQYVGLFSIMMLAGTIVGGEYSVGTIRLILTRGPSRTQLLLGKLGALLFCCIAGVIGYLVLGCLIRLLINLATGIPYEVSFPEGEWIGEALLYTLALIANCFFYAILSSMLSTLGRATVAGVAGGILWYVLEGVIKGLLSFAPAFAPGPTANIISAIPDYFPGTNANALLVNHELWSMLTSEPSIPDWRAWLIISIYAVCFLGISWWITNQRDITQ